MMLVRRVGGVAGRMAMRRGRLPQVTAAVAGRGVTRVPMVRVTPAAWGQLHAMSTEGEGKSEADAAEVKEEATAGTGGAEETGADAEQESGDGELSPEEQIEALEGQVKELTDQRLRLLAEMENVRKIARNDVDRAKKFAAKSFAKSLLDIADNLDRAMECVPPEARTGEDNLLVTLFEGVQMTETIMLKVFAKHGIERFGEAGDDFDPHVHDALFQVPNSDLGAGKVAQVLKTGYMFHDMVLRPAQVGTTPTNN